MVHNRIMKDEKLIIGLSNSLFGREKNSTKYGRDAFRFYHPGSLGRRQTQRPGGVAARAVCLVQPRHTTGRGTAAPGSVARQDPPRQRPPRPAHATSALCRATMHGAAQAFSHARAIGAAKSVSLKKTDSVRFKTILKKG